MSRRECERQVALVRSGTAGGQRAAQALSNLAVIDLDYAE